LLLKDWPVKARVAPSEGDAIAKPRVTPIATNLFIMQLPLYET